MRVLASVLSRALPDRLRLQVETAVGSGAARAGAPPAGDPEAVQEEPRTDLSHSQAQSWEGDASESRP